MKQWKSISMNRIAGILLGLTTAWIVMYQGMLLSSYLQVKGFQINIMLFKIMCCFIAVAVFYEIVKFFAKKKESRLTMYIIIALVSSAVIIITMILTGSRLFFTLTNQQQLIDYISTEAGTIVMLNLVFLLIVGAVGLFFLVFGLMLRHKVVYINYITDEVKKLEHEGFGRTIAVKGQDELSDLSKTINAMSVAIYEKTMREKLLEQQKNELITSVSHDLRTPLTSIIGYVELLLEAKELTKAEEKEYLEVVKRRLYGLNHMINELFEYTKFNSTDYSLHLKPVNVTALLSHVLSEYEIIYQKHNRTLCKILDCSDVFIAADVDYFVRILQNLLDNALKYGQMDTDVVVNAVVQEKNFIITCSNYSDCIKKEDIQYLFSRFYKSDQSRSDSTSSGLGLSIVKRLVELHGGTISASLKETMITFIISIPVL